MGWGSHAELFKDFAWALRTASSKPSALTSVWTSEVKQSYLTYANEAKSGPQCQGARGPGDLWPALQPLLASKPYPEHGVGDSDVRAGSDLTGLS